MQRCKSFINLLITTSEWYWYDHYLWKDSTKELIPECAKFLYFLSADIECLKKSFITRGKEMCSNCNRFIDKDKQSEHQCPSGIWFTVPSLLPRYSPQQTPNLDILKQFIPAEYHHQITLGALQALKDQLLLAKNEVQARRINVKFDNTAKCFFMDQRYWSNCFKGMVFLFLKALTIPSSEAVMESMGSVMEAYHDRFSYGDRQLDDKRLQKEMCLKMNGPPLIECSAFIRKVLQAYRRAGNNTFAHQLTHQARLPTSSLTVKRLKEESSNDFNHLACLDYS